MVRADRRLSVLMVCAHEPTMDPRIRWEAEGAAQQYDVTVLGFNREDGSEPPEEDLGTYRMVRLRRADVPPLRYLLHYKNIFSVPLPVLLLLTAVSVIGFPILALGEIIVRLGYLTARAVRVIYRVVRRLKSPRSDAAARWGFDCVAFIAGNLRMQFAPATELFFNYIRAMPVKPDVIHCNDLDTLLVGILAKQEFGCRVVYDAHEFWPFADSLSRWLDTGFFWLLEWWLTKKTDTVVTVNPLLAEAMRASYRLPRVHSVPNVEPWVDDRPRLRRSSGMAQLADGRVAFLFQGRFTKARGVEEIIRAWPRVDGSKAALFLRGPDNSWKTAARELAAELGVLGESVYFLDAVTEDELVSAAAEADVGIVPYLPLALNERLACPNKLSQYLHAGLMILTNDLPYVRAVVAESGSGLWYDSDHLDTLSSAVNRIAADRAEMRRCQENAVRFARRSYNWQLHGGLFLRLYAGETDDHPPTSVQLAA